MADLNKVIAKKNYDAASEKLKEEFTPKNYFDFIKAKKHYVNDKDLDDFYDYCLKQLAKYIDTHQILGANKLKFYIECIEKEKEAIKAGINSFVYRSDVEYYIDKIADESVVIIDIEHYPRDIPDEVVEKIKKVQNIFTDLMIVYTDYTDDTRKEIEEERREKDPILFGTFSDRKNRNMNERFYYIADWVDDYCDLTLDKLITGLKTVDKYKDKKILHETSIPVSYEELCKRLDDLKKNNESFLIEETNSRPVRANNVVTENEQKQKTSFFSRMISHFKKGF